MAAQDFITGPFGSAVPTDRQVAPDAGSNAGSTPLQDGARVPLTDVTVAGQPGFAESRAAREARANRPESSILEGIGAAMTTWDTARLIKRVARPTFDNDPKIDQFQWLEHTPEQLDADEREFFADVAVGQKSAEYAMGVIRDRRMAMQAIGDHPVVGLATQFLDPLWIAVPPAVKAGSLTPKVGRAVSAAVAGSTGAAVTALGEGPVSDQEIALSLVVNAAAGAAFYTPGKGLTRADADFPTAATDTALTAAQDAAAASVRMRYRLIEGEADVGRAVYPMERRDAQVDQERSDSETLPALENAKPMYNYGDKPFTLQFDNPMDKAAYILAGKGKSAAHQEILDWAMRVGGTTERDLIKRGEEIRADLKLRAAESGPGNLVVDSTRISALNRRGVTPESLPGKHTMRKFITAVAEGEHPVLAKAAKTLLDLADPKVWDMPVRLSGNARAYVSHGGYAVLRKDSSPFVTVHEAVHVATIRPIQQFLDGKAHTLGPQTRKGVEGLNRLFERLRTEWETETGRKVGKDSPDHTEYAFRDLHEFTAQAASSEQFQKWLASKPGEAIKASAWREFLLHVAEILGIKAKGNKLNEVLDELHTLLTARDTHFTDAKGNKVSYSPKMPFMHDFSNVFTEEAINNAKRYARSEGAPESTKGRLVMMNIDDFLKLAYPREKTYRAQGLSDEQIKALGEEKRVPIRAAINKAGLDEVPFLTLDGNKVVGHEGRHRADVLKENFFDEIPVVLKGNVPPPGSRLLSETGDATAELPPTVVKDAYVPPAMQPEELRPGTVNHDTEAVANAAATQLSRDSARRGLGKKLMWNMHKTMENFGAAGKKVANLLYDNNGDLSVTSVEAHREAILSELRSTQYEFEDLLRKAMAAEGYGTLKMLNPFTSREAYAKQASIEKQVMQEMLRREQAGRMGGTASADAVPPHIKEMADKLDELHRKALDEMKRAGVEGADAIAEKSGYINRRWSSPGVEDILRRLENAGLDTATANKKVRELVSLSLSRANGMEKKLADQIGSAIIDRALRKGYFEDSLFNPAAGEGQIKELRDLLSASGMNSADVERALGVLRGGSDEAGKAGFMKHRLDLDYDVTVRAGNVSLRVGDLLDSRVTSIVDQYTQRVATNSAFARKGLGKRSDVEALREELLKDTPANQREAARDLFDNTIAYYRGEPSGAKVNENFRLYQAYGRSIALAWSGLWQLTEYATAMGEYGLLKTLKYSMQELPGFRNMVNPDAESARALNNVLANHSVSSLRLRPYLARYEDGYEMGTGSGMMLAGQTVGQVVPMANAMKYVHHHQAKVVGNLILDRLEQAAKGNTKAREALAQYGLEAPVMDKLAAEIAAKGFDVDKWDDALWDTVRPAFAKMMDASVLRGRLGDIPAFAAFDPVGKFIFSYRSFVLMAHNKVMAGTLERNGAGAVGLILMYQFPLALAAVQAQEMVKSQSTLTEKDMVTKALGQMGGLGLFSEPLKWATGESNAFGAPGLIPLDRGVKLFQSATNLDPQAGASTALTMLPVISAVPFMRSLSEHIKE